MLSIDGSVDVRCTLEEAWALFVRFEQVAALIPTVEQVDVDGDRVHALVATRLGVLPITSRITLEVVERKPLCCIKAVGVSYLGETIREQISPHREIDGIDVGSVGRMTLHLDLRKSDKAGHISIVYVAQVEAEGRLKKIYQAILKTKAPGMMAEFADNLRRNLEGEGEEEKSLSVVSAPSSWWARLLGWWRGLFLRPGRDP